MSRALTIFIHILLFGLLVWVCLGHQTDIENEVAANANSALAADGIGFARATAEGQRVTLRGTAKTASARSAAEQAALSARGVESVDNQIVLLADAPPPGPDSGPIAITSEAPPEDPGADTANTVETGVDESAGVAPVAESLQVVLDGSARRADVVGLALSANLAADRREQLAARLDAALPGWEVSKAITPNANVPTDLTGAISEVLPALVVANRAELDADAQGIRVDAQLGSFADRTALQATLDTLAARDEFLERNLSWMLDSPPPTVDGCQKAFDDLLGKDSIMFTTNRAEIRETSFPLVDRLVGVARDCNVTVEIEGHTDSRGSVELNNALSQARADTVRNYLIQQGVDSSRISARGFGSARPIADNDTVNGRQANRRIEFSVKRTD